jgi:hypothetical protein
MMSDSGDLDVDSIFGAVRAYRIAHHGNEVASAQLQGRDVYGDAWGLESKLDPLGPRRDSRSTRQIQP